MLIWTNNCALGDMASRVSGLHAVTLANVNVRQVYRLQVVGNHVAHVAELADALDSGSSE